MESIGRVGLARMHLELEFLDPPVLDLPFPKQPTLRIRAERHNLSKAHNSFYPLSQLLSKARGSFYPLVNSIDITLDAFVQ